MKYITTIFLLIFSLSFTHSTYAANQKKIYRHPRAMLTESIAFYEAYCHQEINRIRQEHGLKPLIWWPELADCAREHCQNMADEKCEVGHDGFDERFEHMQTIVRITFFGENVAYCYGYENPIAISVEGWMESEGHRKNILENFEETGIGVAISEDGKFYMTQLFAKRPSSKRMR